MCDHAARAPVACFRTGAAAPERSAARVPPLTFFARRIRRERASEEKSQGRHARWGAVSACPGDAVVSATDTDTVPETATVSATDTGTVTVSDLSSPAFWSAFGGPASPEQRGHSWRPEDV